MKRPALLLALVLLAVAPLPLPAQTPPAAPASTAPEKAKAPVVGAPARNWVLPLFTDKEGYRSMTLRGSEVRPGVNTIAVTDFNITVFSGDAAAHVDTMLLSSAATFFPKEQRATGDGAVRLIRDDAVLTGEGWIYEHTAKKVLISRKVRVVFEAPLNDILK